MKRVTAFILSFLVICSCLASCKKDETVDSFLAEGIWEAVLKSSDTEEGQVIAFKFKDDGTFLFFQNLIVIAGGYYEHNEEKEELVLTNADSSKEIDISCKYSENNEILTLRGAITSLLGITEEDVEFNFAKVSEDDEKYYREDATIAYNIEKQT